MGKRALITGAGGQDGSYLSELLLSKGYEVWGMTRVGVTPNLNNLKDAIEEGLHVIHGDMQDAESLARVVEVSGPDEVYNLAAVSFVPVSWECPGLTMDVNAAGVVRLLEAVRRYKPDAKFYQASTTEMFGAVEESPQRESTPFRPVNIYAAAKLAAHWTAIQYREQFGMFVCCGILGNHESPRRSPQFVTHKITNTIARQVAGLEKGKLTLWTLDSVRDWGYAGDYVEAMHAMLQQDEPDDYCIGTGVGRTVGYLVDTAYSMVGLDWEEWVEIKPPPGFKIDPRAAFVVDASKAQKAFNWKAKTDLKRLIEMLLEADLQCYGRSMRTVDSLHG